jgi:ABC-type glycerol-3-phosphate transport system substrate-binding protein
MFSTSLVLAGCGGSPTPAATSSNQGATTEPATGEATATAQEAAAPAVTTTETVTEVATEAATTEATTGGAEGAAAAGAVEPTPPPPTLQPKPGAVTIEYWEMDWGFQQVLQNLVTEFNKQNPNIYVKMTQLEWGDYTQKLQGAVAAGTPPDISGGDSGLPFNFDAQGQAYPLDDLYNQWKGDGRFEDLTKWGQDKWSYNGHYVGVSWQIDPRAIYYRKDMFDKAGIKPPTTHDELLAAAQKLTDRSKEQFGICVPGKQGSYDTDQFYMTLVFQNGGGLADPEGKPTIDTEEQLRALQFEQELVKAAAPPGTPSYTFAEISQLYQQGKCAMVFNGGWFIGQLTSEAPDALKNTGMLPPLKGRGPKAVQRIVGFYNPWMVYKQSKHPAEAMKFIDFMMKKENLKTIYGSVSGKGSVYKSLRTDPLYQKDPLSKEMADQVEQFAIDYWYPNNKAAVGIGSMGTSIADLIVNPVLAGARSPQDALKDAQQQLAPIFEKQAP